jgi:hypothetical protein
VVWLERILQREKREQCDEKEGESQEGSQRRKVSGYCSLGGGSLGIAKVFGYYSCFNSRP